MNTNEHEFIRRGTTIGREIRILNIGRSGQIFRRSITPSVFVFIGSTMPSKCSQPAQILPALFKPQRREERRGGFALFFLCALRVSAVYFGLRFLVGARPLCVQSWVYLIVDDIVWRGTGSGTR